MTLTATKPPTHPRAKAGPDVRARGDPRTRTTATIGIGLRATANAEGSRFPMTSLSTAGAVFQPMRPIRRRATT